MYWLLRRVGEHLKRCDLAGAVKTVGWTAREHWHERRLGIRSAGMIALDTPAALADDCHHYEGSGYALLHRLFHRIAPRNVDERQVLLDAGCGLGRAMAVAALHPYAAVRGFDLSADLIAQARENLQRATPRLRCRDWRLDIGNAMSWPIADDVTTVFLYNPFRGEVMDRFMASLHASLRRRPRDVTLAFVNPRFFDSHPYPWLTELDRFSGFEPRMGAAFGYRQEVALYRARALPH